MIGATARRVRVWDLLVRTTHWTLAALVIANLLNEGSSPIHRQLGTAALIVVAVRLLWGFVATGYANFATFRPGARAFMAYAATMHKQKPKRYLGHNPAAAWMIVLLWGLVILLGISGWMTRIDFFWGDEWLQDVHAAIAYVLLAAVAVHITAALWMSRVHRENLVAAMWHGFKRAPDKSAADTGDNAR